MYKEYNRNQPKRRQKSGWENSFEGKCFSWDAFEKHEKS